MDIATIPEVSLHGNNPKFIVAIIGHDGNKKMVIRGEPFFSHQDLLVRLTKEVAPATVDCLGGGFLLIMDTSFRKLIRIEDASRDLGEEPDRNMTAEMLRKAFPGFNVEIV